MQVEIMFFLEERATAAGRAACGLFDRKAKIEYDTRESSHSTGRTTPYDTPEEKILAHSFCRVRWDFTA